MQFDRSNRLRDYLAGHIPIHSHSGRLSYIPEDIYQLVHEADYHRQPVFRSRRNRPQTVCIARVSGRDDSERRPASSHFKPQLRKSVLELFEKLAGSKGKRILRSFIASAPKQTATQAAAPPRRKRPSLRRPTSWGSAVRSESSTTTGSSGISAVGSIEETTDPAMRLLTRTAQPLNPLAADPIVIDDDTLTISPTADTFPNINQKIPNVKPIAVTKEFSVAISLAEPCLFLQGFDQHELATASNTAMLRGSLILKVHKPSKLKTVTLKFAGKAVTKWPEGIPPKKIDHEEVNLLTSHVWPFFNAQFPVAEHSTGADHVELLHKPESAAPKRMSIDMSGFLRMNSSNTTLAGTEKRLSVTSETAKNVSRTDVTAVGSVAAKGFKTFMPGDYVYNFELPLNSHLPETIDVDLGNVKYELEASVERPGTFNRTVVGTKEVLVIRTPSEGSLEQVEPIAISRNWDNQLHYDIVISGKSFPLGSQIPIAFKLTPLSKVQCHRIKVFITESSEYYCSNKRVHRTEPARKMLLFEKRADSPPVSTYPGGTMRVLSGGGIPYDMRAAAARGEVSSGADRFNLLGDLECRDAAVGPTEMEMNVQLPTCQELAQAEHKRRLHFDTTYANIQVHHWIKIVLRISRPDTEDPTKRRHFEISIDSPFHILSCRATRANTSLPAYSYPDTNDTSSAMHSCGCPNAIVLPHSTPSISQGESQARSSSDFAAPLLQPPPAAHVHGAAAPATTSSAAPAFQPVLQRPMHIIRAPSYNPPAFEDEQPPPPLMTPPPQYNDIASPTTGLADYFARLSDAHATEDAANAARVNVLLDDGATSEATVAVGGESDEGSEGGRTPTQRRSISDDASSAQAVSRAAV